jgi:gamma-polyglutamate biosynthesis protein CapA
MEKGKAKVLIALIFIACFSLSWFLASRYLVSKLDGTGEIQYKAPWRDDEPVEILFVGDIMLDRSVRSKIDAYGFDYLFEDIKSIFEGADLVVGNLEGTVTQNPSVSQKNNGVLRFTFATSTAFKLRELGFTHVSLANNHALDFGEFGFEDTEHYLTNAGLYFFGSPHNDRNSLSMPIVNEEKICLLGYHSLFNASTATTISELGKSANFCDYTIIFAHWGEEYQDKPEESTRGLARSFIDAGADLIIGAHPHVIQPVEIYKGKAIFYSLGNFVFDQDFSTETRQGLAVRLELTDKTQRLHLIGIEMERSRLYFPEKEAFQPRLDVLVSELPSDLKAKADVDGVLELPR